MLIVSIKIVPDGDWFRVREIGSMKIANTGGTLRSGSYSVRTYDGAGEGLTETTLTNFPRQKLNAWHLLSRALRKVLREAKKSGVLDTTK